MKDSTHHSNLPPLAPKEVKVTKKSFEQVLSIIVDAASAKAKLA